ncbi:MAG TPA: DUF4097 family beta strand repeat-containing protein [Gaiellaceae bacterium]|nr:DUF4097 family beta strand repeat-containing protein [Gaiellaceae bacterium]
MRHETFETGSSVELQVQLGAGEIRLEAANTNETTVQLEPIKHNEATTKAIENARVEMRGGTDRHEVIVDLRGRTRLFRGVEVLVQIRCPEGADLEVRCGSASLQGTGRLGSIKLNSGSGEVVLDEIDADAKINTASGDVRLGDIGGEANINSASGDVELGAVVGDVNVNTASGDITVRAAGGKLKANSASGEVTVREARSSLSVNTASGDQTVGRLSEGRAELKSASGDLAIGIKEGATLWVDARSRSGSVRSELPVSETPPEGAQPQVELKANTMSGDVEITRA